MGSELELYKPTRVLNAAGLVSGAHKTHNTSHPYSRLLTTHAPLTQTGRPNVDWCEDHKAETIRTNVIGTLNLADLCCERGIHVTLYATGWYGSILCTS
jgi:hypothetical protein